MPEKDGVFRRILWTRHDDIGTMSDGFVAESFRVRLMGTALELSFEGSGTPPPGSASALGERYTKALSKHLVVPITPITEEEFLELTEPPLGNFVRTVDATTHGGHERQVRAIREARGELLGGGDQTLRRCYDLLQNASERMRKLDAEGLEGAAHAVYKLIEVLEERFGDSEAQAVEALGAVFKQTKRAANEARHIPKQDQPHSVGFEKSVELARETVRAYERHLLKSE
jgi:hypothetical protein